MAGSSNKHGNCAKNGSKNKNNSSSKSNHAKKVSKQRAKAGNVNTPASDAAAAKAYDKAQSFGEKRVAYKNLPKAEKKKRRLAFWKKAAAVFFCVLLILAFAIPSVWTLLNG